MSDIALDEKALAETQVEFDNVPPGLVEAIIAAWVCRASPSQVAPQPQAGEAVADGLEEALRLAEVGEYLYSQCAYSYGNGYDEPREYGIEWQWQQSKTDEYGQGQLLAAAVKWHEEQASDGTVTEASKLRAALASPQPANPAQVTDALPAHVDRAISVIQEHFDLRRSDLLAAIGAGGQAVGDSLWVPAKPEHAKIGWTYDFDQTERLSRAAEKATGYDATMEVVEFVMAEADRRHKSALSQPHPADERVVEALRELSTPPSPVQKLGAAISRRDWHEAEQAHALIRDALDSFAKEGR